MLDHRIGAQLGNATQTIGGLDRRHFRGTAVGLGAFLGFKADSQLQWVDYNEASLRQYQAQGKTVLLDFSAKWCVNCLVNLETAIDTRQTRELVEELDVIVMYADWTNHDPEVTQKLEELNSKSIPMLAIYPGDRPERSDYSPRSRDPINRSQRVTFGGAQRQRDQQANGK